MTGADSALLGVYRTPPFHLVRGEGSEVVDETGKRYLDFTSGIGVNALGHGHPVVLEAIERGMASALLHTSNLFRTRPAEELARALTEHAGLDRAFFCNSGAESVEGALKFARKWAKSRGGPDKHRVVALRGAFHGRLFGSLAVTDRPDYQRPYEPLMPGVDFANPEDLSEIGRLLDRERTAALIVEPIQGEGGIRPFSAGLLRQLRTWTEEREIALILDEIQCGLGRAGFLFAHEPSGIRPDLLCLAKPLGGGLPMGVVLLADPIAEVLQPGDHGTTFGGGPLVCTVALAVLQTVSEPGFLERVRDRGRLLHSLLETLTREHPAAVHEIRGGGLLWGIELTGPCAAIVERSRDAGLLTVPAGTRVIRLLPPLTVSEEELHRAVSILEGSLS